MRNVLLIFLILSWTANAAAAPGKAIKITSANKSSFELLAKGLACFLKPGTLGTLSKPRVVRGAKFHPFNAQKKIAALKRAISRLKSRLRKNRGGSRAARLQLKQLKKSLRNIVLGTSTCRSRAQEAFANSISQYGITWKFDRSYRVGRFANGDYWVLGPVTILSITPDFTGTQNGFEVNPKNVEEQGFDSRVATFNAALVPALPLTISQPASVVKAISNADTRCSYNQLHSCPLQTAAVLTVLRTVPENDGRTVFRPGYFGQSKELYPANRASLRTELLPSLKSPGSATEITEMARRVQRVQLDHKESWTGRAMHPQDNLPDYGADIALMYDNAALRLMLSDSLDEKWPLLVNYLQAGIDLYSILKNGGNWSEAGGHGPGRKLPIIFASLLLGDEEMQQAVMNAKKTYRATFAEDGGVVYSARADGGRGKALFGQDAVNDRMYWNVARWDDAGGSKTGPDPYGYIDGCTRPGQSYDALVLGSWKGASLAVRMIPAGRMLWNNEDFFSHVDRRITFGMWTQPDPCAPMDGRCVGGSNSGGYCNTAGENGSGCVPNLSDNDGWCNSYCPGGYCNYSENWPANYGVTYGPDGNGDCIKDTDPSDGLGRFPARHGSSRDEGVYQSAFVNRMWNLYFDYAAGKPNAAFTVSPRSGYIPLAMRFDAALSSDSDGFISGYSWDFGDGGSAKGRTATHTYAAQGSFTVTLTVTDNSGKTASGTDVVMVADPSYVHEDFELMSDITKRLAPYGMDFEVISGGGIIGEGGHSGIDSKALLLRNAGAPMNMLVSRDGRNSWSNYTLSLTLGMGYVEEGGLVLHYKDASNYYLLNVGTHSSGGRLERVANGVKTILAGTGDNISLPWGRISGSYTIYSTIGDTVHIAVVKDGTLTKTFTDTGPGAKRGSIGFYEPNPGQFNYLAADNIDLKIQH